MPNRRDPETAGRRGGAGGGAPAPDAEQVLGAALGGLPPALADLPWELPHTFLGLDEVVPWEATTSYGGGTRLGPRAILEASRYIELYDQELDAEPGAEMGVHTLPSLELTRAGAREAMDELRHAYARIAEAAGDRFLLMLGGEHAVSAPAILAQAARHPGRISVLQMDAHADLRPEYEGTPHSHASAMARVLPEADVVAVGIRAVSREEVVLSRASDASTIVWAEEMRDGEGWMDRAVEALGDDVYLTFDVDYFDPSLVPSTGTPEPGGGEWHATLRFLRRVFQEKNVVAADVVELAPTPGLHAPDFLVAKLVYKLLAYRFESEAAR